MKTAIAEAAFPEEPLAEQLIQADAPRGEDADVAVQREDEVAILEASAGALVVAGGATPDHRQVFIVALGARLCRFTREAHDTFSVDRHPPLTGVVATLHQCEPFRPGYPRHKKLLLQ